MTDATGTDAEIESEIASQPACWAQVAEALDEHVGKLPAAGERVAVVGCGTSLYMAKAYAALREAAGQGETDAFPASEYRLGRRYDRLVAITRSGTTTEVLDVLGAVGGRGGSTPAVAITGAGDLPIAHLADAVVVLHVAERSVVQTRFPTTVLALLRASLGEDLEPVIAAGADAVTAPLPVLADRVHQITFLGAGWASGIADEAALKCREAAAFWTESYPSMEYRHGPITVSGPGTAVWMFGDPPPGLAADVAGVGAQFIADRIDPMADLIRAQRVAVALARHAGRDPDHPPALSYSIVLDGGRHQP